MAVRKHDEKEREGDTAKLRRTELKILKWYGSFTPKRRPEDFQRVREV